MKNQESPASERRVALMAHGERLGLLSVQGTVMMARFHTARGEMNYPMGGRGGSATLVQEHFKGLLAKARQAGWDVFYVGPPLQG